MSTSAIVRQSPFAGCVVAVTLSLTSNPSPAATVVSSQHYQKEIPLTCGAQTCSGTFPKPGTTHQLNLTRMSCQLRGPAGSEYDTGQLQLHASDGSHVLYEHLPVEHSSSNGYHILDRAIDVQVGAKQYINVDLFLVGGSALYGFCTAFGTLDTLQ